MVRDVLHPHVIKLLGHCYDGTNKCLVYEFVPGVPLSSWLLAPNRSMQFPFRARIEILIATAEVLVHLHSLLKPIIHRDVNATNILITEDSMVPKMIGFSISMELGDGETDHQELDILGFPIFKDPIYKSSGHRSSLTNDIYSFGILIIQTISGRVRLSQGSIGSMR